MPQTSRTARERVRHSFLKLFSRKYRRGIEPDKTLPGNVLLIRPDHVGDLLLATPAIAQLRKLLVRRLGASESTMRITGMVGPWGEKVWRNNEYIDDLIVCRFPGFERAPKSNPIAPYLLLFRCARMLKQKGFDAAVILRFDHWWGAWLAAEAGIPTRIGFDTPDVKPFLTEPLAYAPGFHEAVQNWKLLRELARDQASEENLELTEELHFRPAEGAEEEADRILAESGISANDRIVVIHPGSGALVKRWEPWKWAAVADALAGEFDVKILLTGGPGEKGIVGEVAERCKSGVVNLAGRTSLDVLAAILRRACLAMGPDSGILHLAASQGTHTLGLYGPADPALFGPWPPDCGKVVMSDWDCAPCGRLDFTKAEIEDHRCVRDIPVERVLSEATRFCREGSFSR
jgi:ADP-heptose:LPS heptosyltransferase